MLNSNEVFVTEKRKFLRFETALSAICEFVHLKHKASYKVKNISKEGALLTLDQRLREGEEFNVSMDIPGDNVPIFASCRVAWQRQSDRASIYETGVKFTQINNLDKGRLLEYTYLQWLRLLDRTP